MLWTLEDFQGKNSHNFVIFCLISLPFCFRCSHSHVTLLSKSIMDQVVVMFGWEGS